MLFWGRGFQIFRQPPLHLFLLLLLTWERGTGGWMQGWKKIADLSKKSRVHHFLLHTSCSNSGSGHNKNRSITREKGQPLDARSSWLNAKSTRFPLCWLYIFLKKICSSRKILSECKSIWMTQEWDLSWFWSGDTLRKRWWWKLFGNQLVWSLVNYS